MPEKMSSATALGAASMPEAMLPATMWMAAYTPGETSPAMSSTAMPRPAGTSAATKSAAAPSPQEAMSAASIWNIDRKSAASFSRKEQALRLPCTKPHTPQNLPENKNRHSKYPLRHWNWRLFTFYQSAQKQLLADLHSIWTSVPKVSAGNR